MRPTREFRVHRTAAALMLAALGPAPGAAMAAADAAADAAPAPAVAREKSWFATQLRRFRNYPHLDRGYQLLKTERLAEARREFDAAVRIDPDDIDARISYALLLYKLRAYPECAAQLDQVLQQRPEHLSARLNRALARTALEQFDAALDDFQRVAESPGVARQDWLLAKNMIAELAVKRQRTVDALAALDDLVRSSAPDADLFFRRGVANEASKRLAQADEDFRRSLALAREPQQRLRAHEAIARNARVRGDMAATQASLAAALEIDPNNLPLLRALVQASVDQGLHAQAIRWVRLALERQPDPQDRRMLAELLMRTSNYRDAARQYAQLAAAPGDAAQSFHVHMSLGYAYSNLGRWSEAADAFGQAADLKPDETALQAQALALESAGRPAKAVEPLLRLRALRPTDAQVDLRLGELYARTGDLAAALRHLDQATRAGAPAATRGAAYRQRGMLLYAQGAYAAARQAQESAARLMPKDVSLYAALAETCVKLGAYQDAVGYLRRSAGVREASATMRALTQAYREAQNWEAAIEAGRALLDLPGLTPPQKAEALEDLGIAYYQSGKRELAADALQRAFDGGRAGWQARRILGLALFELERFDAALPHFRASVEQHRTAEGLAYVARAYHALRKPGLSVHYLELALAEGNALDSAFKTKLYDELGYLLSDAAEYARAADAFGSSLALDPRADTALRLARMQRLSGQPERAGSTLRAIALDALDPPTQLSIQEELAQVHAARRQHREAIDALTQANGLQPTAQRAYEIGLHFLELKQPRAAIPALEAAVAQAPRQARYAQTLGYAYSLDGQPERAESTLRAIALDTLDMPTRALVYDQLARSQASQRRYADAVEALSRAEAIEPTAERLYQIGLYRLELGQLQPAIASLEAALARQPGQIQYAETLGYAYNRSRRYGDAARMLEQVLVSDPDREVLYRELGYIHMHNLDNDAAVQWFKRGIDYRASRLAAERQRASAPPRPMATADGLPDRTPRIEPFERDRSAQPSEPPAPQPRPIEPNEPALRSEPSDRNPPVEPDLKAGPIEQLDPIEPMALIDPPDLDGFPDGGRPQPSAVSSQAAIAPRPGPTRGAESPDGEPPALAVASRPKETPRPAAGHQADWSMRRVAALSYGYQHGQRYSDAERPEPVASFEAPHDDGQRPRVRRVPMREQDAPTPTRPLDQVADPQAPSPSAAAVPPRAAPPGPARPSPAEDDAVIRQMRQEVAKLSNRFDTTFYQSYRANSSRQAAVASPSTGGVIPSQGGMELAYQPPVIGFRDERVLQVYARALWGNRPSSLAIERESLQGGIGVRYKPLKAQQLYVSAERLVKIGDRSEDNWLLRASYGWQNGVETPPDRDSWNYTTLYVDVGYFAATPRRRALYAEARQGRSFKVASAWSVTPHLVLNGRSEHPAPTQASYLEGGVGVSFRYQFDESRYETYRSSLELLLQYKRGIVHSGSGWVMTLIARF